jgi:hypothetical protein
VDKTTLIAQQDRAGAKLRLRRNSKPHQAATRMSCRFKFRSLDSDLPLQVDPPNAAALDQGELNQWLLAALPLGLSLSLVVASSAGCPMAFEPWL